MKFKCIAVFTVVLLVAGTLFSSPVRTVRSVGNMPEYREHEVVYPRTADDHLDTLAYEDPDNLPYYLTLPSEWEDESYNVRFTPFEAPFQIFAIHIPIFNVEGRGGTPGMRLTVWESGEQDGERGYPTEEIASVDIDFEDIIIGDTTITFNDIDISHLGIAFNDEVDFHVSVNVIADEETDTLGIYMDDGEFVEDSRSGLFLGGEDVGEFPWVRLQDLEGFLPYNFAIRAVVGEPGEADPDVIIGNGVSRFAPYAILVDPAFPNPFNEFTTVKINVPQGIYYNAQIIDHSGRAVQYISEGVGNGISILNIRAASYPAGNYFLKLSTAQQDRLVPLIYLK